MATILHINDLILVFFLIVHYFIHIFTVSFIKLCICFIVTSFLVDTAHISSIATSLTTATPANIPHITTNSVEELGPYDPSLCGGFRTDRVKLRSLTAKQHQRLLPTGAPWAWFGWHTV